MLKLPMAVIAVSASFSLSHAFNSVDELCSAFAAEMTTKHREDALRVMQSHSHNFEGYQFTGPLSKGPYTVTEADDFYYPISKIEGSVALGRTDDFSHLPKTSGNSESGVCQFQAMSVDNPTPGMKTLTYFTIDYTRTVD